MSSTPTVAAGKAGVHGQYLIVPTMTALPMRCIVSNQPVSNSEYQSWDMPCIPRWLIALMYLSPLFMITAPFIRRRCRMRAGLSRSARRRRTFLKAVAVAVLISPFVAVAFGLAMRSQMLAVSGVIASAFTYFGLAAFVLRTLPMRARYYREGVFWVTGCSPAFLASLTSTPLVNQQDQLSSPRDDAFPPDFRA